MLGKEIEMGSIKILDDKIVRITDDEVGIGSQRNPILFIATGGPEDPIEVRDGKWDFYMDRQDVEDFQKALLNFLNTGFFNPRGIR